MEPAPVVEQALARLGRDPVSISGRANRLAHLALSRLVPRTIALARMANVGRSLDTQRRDR